MCPVLMFGSLTMMFPPSQSMVWFLVVAWSDRADLLMLNSHLFSIFHSSCPVIFTPFLCSSSRVFSSKYYNFSLSIHKTGRIILMSDYKWCSRLILHLMLIDSRILNQIFSDDTNVLVSLCKQNLSDDEQN